MTTTAPLPVAPATKSAVAEALARLLVAAWRREQAALASPTHPRADLGPQGLSDLR